MKQSSSSANYHSFSKTEFLNDESFIAWIRNGKLTTSNWGVFEQSKPANLMEFKLAQEELDLIFSLNRIVIPRDAEQEIWQKISATIEIAGSNKNPLRVLIKNYWITVTAAASVLITAALWMVWSADVKVETAYSELKDLILPDSSEVHINANSALTFKNDWQVSDTRELYLKGEGFFNVKKITGKGVQKYPFQKFIVHTSTVDIEVLGTSFNVKERRGITEIALLTGSLRVKAKIDTGRHIILLPGQVAIYNSFTQSLTLQSDSASSAPQWMDKKMHIQNIRVSDLLHDFEDIYGYSFIVSDSSIFDKKLVGVIPLKNEENALYILAAILNVDLEKNKKTVTIKRKK